jgi:RNA polymerase sigma factor (sigma-70 family)
MTLEPFQTVVDRHAPALHRYLVAMAGCNDADDCFQETLLAALRAYDGLDGKADVRAWLFTIAHNKAIDSHRARGRRATPLADVPEQATNDRHMGNDDDLWALVRALPEKQRGAVTLRFVGDMAHAEIAAALACSTDAARRNLHEGLAKLREEWTR